MKSKREKKRKKEMTASESESNFGKMVTSDDGRIYFDGFSKFSVGLKYVKI